MTFEHHFDAADEILTVNLTTTDDMLSGGVVVSVRRVGQGYRHVPIRAGAYEYVKLFAVGEIKPSPQSVVDDMAGAAVPPLTEIDIRKAIAIVAAAFVTNHIKLAADAVMGSVQS